MYICKTGTNLQTKNNLMVTKGMGERDKLETGSNIYTLLYVKQITNKDLL